MQVIFDPKADRADIMQMNIVTFIALEDALKNQTAFLAGLKELPDEELRKTITIPQGETPASMRSHILSKRDLLQKLLSLMTNKKIESMECRGYG